MLRNISRQILSLLHALPFEEPRFDIRLNSEDKLIACTVACSQYVASVLMCDFITGYPSRDGLMTAGHSSVF